MQVWYKCCMNLTLPVYNIYEMQEKYMIYVGLISILSHEYAKNSRSEILAAPSISNKEYSTRITSTVKHIRTFDKLTLVKKLGTRKAQVTEGRITRIGRWGKGT